MGLIHTFQRFIRRLALPSQINTVSSEFLAWRQQFFTERLQLLAWIVWIVLILVTLLNLTVVIPSLNSTGDPKLMFSYARMQNYLERALSQVICFSIGLLICRSPWIHQAPVKVFLIFNALILLPSQIQAALYGGISLDSEIWLIFYPLQAFLIPVHWRLQVLCQAVPLVYFLIGFIFGLRDPYINLLPPYVVTGLYTLVICAVADSGAFLFERSRRREMELRQQLRAFIHAVSHDLRNPVLGAVMTLKSFLKPSEPMATIPQELLEQMIASGERQVALINTLLETHATELQGLAIYPKPISLTELVANILQDFQPFFQQNKTSINNVIPDNLPLIYVDSLQFRRVYENLISNALKYNPTRLHLTLDAEIIQQPKEKRRHKFGKAAINKPNNKHNKSNINWMRCTVSDNGIGIPPEQCDRLFDLYSRGRDQRRSLSLGLGLYMCRQIISAHGGEIGVISSPEKGSTFWFTVPIVQK
jgi:signal transduction histidine kinase